MADCTGHPLICLACLDIPIVFESSASIKESLLCTRQWTRCNVQTLANQARNWLNWSTVEPRYNEGPRDWQIVSTIRRFLFIKVVFHILYYFWGKEYHLLYWGFCCIEVLEIKVPLYFLVHHFHIDHNVPCLPPKILYSHCFQFFLDFTVIPRVIKDNGFAKYLGVNEVHIMIYVKMVNIEVVWSNCHVGCLLDRGRLLARGIWYKLYSRGGGGAFIRQGVYLREGISLFDRL